MNNQSKQVFKLGFPVFTAAALALLVLKLIGYSISWLWIFGIWLFPLMVILAIVFVILVVVFCVFVGAWIIDATKDLFSGRHYGA
jgi:hypothetical protein